jgi:hypothetical protein
VAAVRAVRPVLKRSWSWRTSTGGVYRGPVAVRLCVPWPDGRWQDDEGRCNSVLPAELHVESRAVTPDDFAHVVGPLERLFRASLETGNPGRWC